MAKCFSIKTKMPLSCTLCVCNFLTYFRLFKKKQIAHHDGKCSDQIKCCSFTVAQVALFLPSNCLSRYLLMRGDGYVTEIIYLNI